MSLGKEDEPQSELEEVGGYFIDRALLKSVHDESFAILKEDDTCPDFVKEYIDTYLLKYNPDSISYKERMKHLLAFEEFIRAMQAAGIIKGRVG